MQVKWKVFDWYVKNYNILSIFTLFQLVLGSLFAFLKMALWFHFSENAQQWNNWDSLMETVMKEQGFVNGNSNDKIYYKIRNLW